MAKIWYFWRVLFGKNTKKYMRINKMKLQCNDDYVVVRAFLRALKEDNYSFNKHSFEYIRQKCYDSRENHPTESFDLNIQYWFGDCGISISKKALILYLALIAKGVKEKNVNRVITRLITELNGVIENEPFYLLDIYAYIGIINKALKNSGKSEKEIGYLNKKIEFIIKGIGYDIPF
jgi:hypothetical protein